MTAALKSMIRRRARAEGFDVVGFAAPDAVAAAGDRLQHFIEKGRHGDMGWMAETALRRAHPHALWPEARTAIMVGVNYGPRLDPMARLEDGHHGVISIYALGSDYHDLIKTRLKALARWLVAETGTEVKVFVDTAPLMEKPLAEASGLGWQGKHTNLVSREFGSWLFLGAILASVEIEPDPAGEDYCGSCRACLDICPTDAFPAPYQLDARRCISYLTIEHRGHIDHAFRKPIGNRIFGCDDCLAVCPWNKFAKMGEEHKLQAREALVAPDLTMLAELDDEAFRALFRGSPVKRTGRDRFVRNVLIAIGNSGRPDLATVAQRRLDDRSSLVRAMAVWALGELLPRSEFLSLRERREPMEDDPSVRVEWEAAA